MSVIQRRAEQAAERGVFLGGPVRRFERAGRMQFELLLDAGLQPHHRVVDVGAGALRLGVWLMDYLEPGNYRAIEPNVEMVRAGIEICGEDLVERSAPLLDHNDRFDLSAVGACDLGMARSIWTHASMDQIDQLLESWARFGRGPLFASYLPARCRSPYRGSSWVGISHRSGQRGLVRHRLDDIRRRAARHGLDVSPQRGRVMGRQRWLRVQERQPASAADGRPDRGRQLRG